MEENIENLDKTSRGEEFLEHFGVKGMRWGVRRDSTTPSTKAPEKPKTPTPVAVSQQKGSSKLKTSGGERQPASDDAIRAAVISQKLKKSGVNSLSNRELQDVVMRLNLERQISTVTTQQKSRFQKNAEEVMQNVMKKQMANLINTGLNAALKTAMESAKKK